MQSNPMLPDRIALEKIMRFASSAAGQEFISLLNQKDSDAYRKALTSAQSGDYTKVQKYLEDILKDPAIQNTLKQLGG